MTPPLSAMDPRSLGVAILMRPPFAKMASRFCAVLGCAAPPGTPGTATLASGDWLLAAGAGILLDVEGFAGCPGWLGADCSVFWASPGGGVGRVSLKKNSDAKRIATESTTARIRFRLSIMGYLNLSKVRWPIHDRRSFQVPEHCFAVAKPGRNRHHPKDGNGRYVLWQARTRGLGHSALWLPCHRWNN